MTNDFSSVPDARLVAWIIDGRPECMGELIARYGPALQATLRRTLGQDTDIEDVVQDTWVRVIRYGHRYDPTFAFSTWLFRVAWNLAQDRLKQRARLSHQAASTYTHDSQPGSEKSPEAQCLGHERACSVQVGIDALPAHLKEAILLRYFEDLSEREMAERLDIPAGTVKSRLHGAHRRLAALLGEAL